LAAAVTAVVLVVPPAALGGAAERDVSAIHAMQPGLPVVGGWSALVRNDNGIAATVHAEGLAPGTVVTLWWVVFNDPSRCTWGSHAFADFGADGQLSCALGDVLFNPAAVVSVQYAAGHVIGGSGTADYGAYLGEGDTSGCAAAALPCNGLLDSRAADVHLVLRSHGMAIPGLIDEQLSSFNGGCPPNACMNLEASPHEVG